MFGADKAMGRFWMFGMLRFKEWVCDIARIVECGAGTTRIRFAKFIYFITICRKANTFTPTHFGHVFSDHQPQISVGSLFWMFGG